MQNKKLNKEIAVNEIKRLFKLAAEVFEKNPKRADRYIEIAENISTKLKVRIPSIYRKRYCKKCGSFLLPGKNLRVRTKNKAAVYTCLNCGNIRRFILKKSK
ncbi:MAG: ribonuclease P protein component 4 [Candidatus Nanoarchaeia archaeon]|nr:ribonuclease P protein component 4 [Candidatus Nanoarchaeia archaeon]